MMISKRYPYLLFGNEFFLGFTSDKSDEIESMDLVPFRDIPNVIRTVTDKGKELGKRMIPVIIYDAKAFTFSVGPKAAQNVVILERIIAEVA